MKEYQLTKPSKEIWQPYYKEELTDEEADEMTKNFVGFFTLLIECDLEQKSKLLSESEIFCKDCNTQIKTLNNFYRRKKNNYCLNCFENNCNKEKK